MTDTDHVPAPAEHAPRKETIIHQEGWITVYEERNMNTYIQCENPVPVRE